MRRLSSLGLSLLLVMAMSALGDEPEVKRERGKDTIVVPAKSDGLRLHALFQSNMVIQRDKPIKIWGWAAPGEEVSVAFGDLQGSAKAGDDGAWAVEFDALSASSAPRKLTVRGKDKALEIENILVGDVWLLGGQSNMEFEIAKIDGGQLEIASANFPEIRLLTVPQQDGPESKESFPRQYKWSGWFGRHFRQGFWDVCTPETVREMSGIGYIFGRRLHMASQVPIGLVDASRGGTCVETWLPLKTLGTIDTPEVKAMLEEWETKVAEYDAQEDLAKRIKKHHDWLKRMEDQGREIPDDRKKEPTDLRPGPAMNMNRPGNCYASVIAPIAGFPIKGAIWHQGFNNAMQPNGHVMYYQVFSKMIECWRKAFNDPEMPFGIISLCTAGAPQDEDNYVEMMANEGVYIRQVQYQTFLDLKEAGDENIGFASSYDQRRSWYHPQIKIPVGERIAKWALSTEYGFGNKLRWEPPFCKEMKVEEGRIVLNMSANVRPYNDGSMLGFAVAGEDGRFQPAKAEHLVTGKDKRGRPQRKQNMIVLTSPLVPKPVHYRYAWGRNPLANVREGDIPLGTQRTDKWTLTDTYVLYTGKQPETPGVLSRAERGELRKTLKEADLERRFKEVEAFVEKHAESKEKP